jgi:hypothetical protein
MPDREVGATRPGRVLPDFTFATSAGDMLVWEHLGRLDRDDYRADWDWKRLWYRDNGFNEGESLFTSMDDEHGGLHMPAVNAIAEVIQAAI